MGLEDVTKSLKRVQETNAEDLARTGELGKQYNFAAVVEPAKRLIDLFQMIQVDLLPELPAANVDLIRQHADAVFSFFENIRKFNIDQGNLATFRQQVTQQLKDQYPATWGNLAPIIAFGSARLTDFTGLERQARATIQGIDDKTAKLVGELEDTRNKATEALAAAQKAAAEQGVSQQAHYFREEANTHETSATQWQTRTVWLAVGLALYAVLTIFVHKWTFLRPTDTFESAQLITSKILLFAVLSYMLILASKNFLSHKHNAIVNRHRQNALMTFNALATATTEDAAKDIILTHAASCIFAPQETGYAKGSQPESSLGQAMAGLLAKGETKGS